MLSQLGSIVLIKNVIFKKTNMEKRKAVDHAYNSGRPALVICETDEKMYHLLLTHSCYRKKKMGNYFPLFNDSSNFDGYIDLCEIHSRALYYAREYACINDEDLYRILVALCKFQEKYNFDDEYEEIKPYLYKQIDELGKKMQKNEKCLKKERK